MRRHRWDRDSDHPLARKECADCHMVAETFGGQRAKYSIFYDKDGQEVANTANGDKTPPCEPPAVDGTPPATATLPELIQAYGDKRWEQGQLAGVRGGHFAGDRGREAEAILGRIRIALAEPKTLRALAQWIEDDATGHDEQVTAYAASVAARIRDLTNVQEGS